MQSTMMDFPLTLTHLMRYGTTCHGDAQVMTWTGDGVRTATLADVGERGGRLANVLRGFGIDDDQRVGTFCWNDQEHVEAYLAVPAMGAVLHPINIRLSPEQMAYVTTHAEDQVVVVDESLAAGFGKLLPHLKTVKHVLVTGASPDLSAVQADGVEVHAYEEALAAADPAYDWPELDERRPANMCYTSGTTGNPKGVVYSHRSTYLHAMAVCRGDVLGIGPRDRSLPIVPMFHANAWGTVHASVLVGADLVLPERHLQGEPIAKMIEATRPTLTAAIPTIWNALLQYGREHEVDLSSLRAVLCGGSAVPRSLMEAYEKEFGVIIRHAWGMTETSPLASVAIAPRGTEGEEEMAYRLSQGKLMPEIAYRLVADDEILPNDGRAVGELEVRGPWVTGSYYRDDDAEKFHDGWLRTGDVGMIDERGFFTITDRAKDVIKSGGEWISTVDMENALMGHPDVVEAAVVGIPDEKWTERPLALVVVREGAELDADGLRESLGDRFASWQLPDAFAVVDEVPKTSVGKFDKKLMRKQYADGELDVRGEKKKS